MTIKGMDVSNWQGTPTLAKWQQAKTAGYVFAAIKASEGTSRDVDFVGNWQYAGQAGFTVRIAYHFARPGTGAQAEANTLVAAVQAAGGLAPGDNIAIDAEAGSGEVGSYIHDLLHTAATALGLNDPFAYSGNWFISGHLDDPDLAEHHLWDAVYNAGSQFPSAVGPWSGKTPVIWQHADNENVPGFGAIDGDLFSGTIAELAALGKGGSAPSEDDAMTPDQLEALNQWAAWETFVTALGRVGDAAGFSWLLGEIRAKGCAPALYEVLAGPEYKGSSGLLGIVAAQQAAINALTARLTADEQAAITQAQEDAVNAHLAKLDAGLAALQQASAAPAATTPTS
jgi:GH25 family lysozyme M1 (1,4-beta-N-acetylmuramidase)